MVGESKFHNFILGSVFLGGILLIGLATLLVRGFGFSERQEIDIRFDNVANLARGEPVVVHGVRVGEVSDVRYARAPGEAGDVLVVVSVEKAVFPLPPETQFVVRSLGPLGGKYVEIVLPENGAAPNGGGA
ncbi:MAG TPA: MlaD family protein, partial [Planctomycetota bacterium]|nr:MlaD family protein [Planctomycetota bacterium]